MFNHEGAFWITFTYDDKKRTEPQMAMGVVDHVLDWQKRVWRNHFAIDRRQDNLLWVEELPPHAMDRPSPQFSRYSNYRRRGGTDRRFCTETGIYCSVAETAADWNERKNFQPKPRRVWRGPYRKLIPKHCPDLLVGVEETKGGRLHAHALMGAPLRREWVPDFTRLWREWYDVHGYIDIKPVEVSRVADASSYAMKALDYSLKASFGDIRSWDPDFARFNAAQRRSYGAPRLNGSPLPLNRHEGYDPATGGLRQPRHSFWLSRGIPQM